MAKKKDKKESKKERSTPWENPEYRETAKQYGDYGGYPESGPEARTPAGPAIVKGPTERAREPESEGEEFFTSWFDNPETREKLKDQLGLDDDQVNQAINHALSAQQEVSHDVSAGKYETGGHKITTNPGPRGEGSLPHELVHATGIDDALGSILREQIGDPSGFGPLSNYLKSDGELYGNFFDLRNLLELEPGDWVTPELLENRIESLGIDEEHPRRFEIDQMLEVFDIEQLAEGLDKIASVEADKERLERLNFSPDEFVISREPSLYT